MKSGSPPRGLSLKTVLESTADSVFVLDRDWRFAYLNPRAKAQIAGGRDLTGEVVWEAVPEARETAFWATYHKAMDERQLGARGCRDHERIEVAVAEAAAQAVKRHR